jgi:AcrR family transcriptional regulator
MNAPRRRTDTEGLKQERAIRTRALILDAAAESFAGKGYPDTTILDVAQLTGATKGAVYFHFANKNALAVAVTEEFYARLQHAAREVLECHERPLSAVAALLVRTGELFRDDRVIQAGARLQIEQSLIDADLPAPFVDFTERVTELLRQAVKAGELPEGSEPDALGRVLVSAFFGAQHMSWVLNGRADMSERVHEILAAVLPQALVKEDS